MITRLSEINTFSEDSILFKEHPIGFSYHFQKLIESLVTTPGLFVFLFFVAALLVRKYRPFFLIAALLFYLTSIYYTGNKMVHALEKPYNIPLQEANVDGVVVLGAGYYKGSSNLPLEESSFKRFMYGIMIAKKRQLPIIYAGAFNEREAAQLTTQELNDTLDLNLTTPKDGKLRKKFAIYYTKNSANTAQNAAETYALFHEQGIAHPKIYLVTSASHMHRAKPLFEAYGIEVVPAATDFKTRSDSCYCFYYPTSKGLQLNDIAVHEILGYLRDTLKNLL